MKSAAIYGAARSLKATARSLSEDFIIETMSLTMMLIREKNREVYKSVLYFLKVNTTTNAASCS